jgi:hypothetical protein
MAPAGDIVKPSRGEGLILEAWAQGYMVGSLIIMAGITVANMRRGVLLHKLILIEVRLKFSIIFKFSTNSILSSSSSACRMELSSFPTHQLTDGTSLLPQSS